MVCGQKIHHGFRYFLEIDPREVCLGHDVVREKDDIVHSLRYALCDLSKLGFECALESAVLSSIVSYVDEMEGERS